MLHLLHSQDRDPYPGRPGTLRLLHLPGSSNRGLEKPFVPHEPVRQEPTDRWRSVFVLYLGLLQIGTVLREDCFRR